MVLPHHTDPDPSHTTFSALNHRLQQRKASDHSFRWFATPLLYHGLMVPADLRWGILHCQVGLPQKVFPIAGHVGLEKSWVLYHPKALGKSQSIFQPWQAAQPIQEFHTISHPYYFYKQIMLFTVVPRILIKFITFLNQPPWLSRRKSRRYTAPPVVRADARGRHVPPLVDSLPFPRALVDHSAGPLGHTKCPPDIYIYI